MLKTVTNAPTQGNSQTQAEKGEQMKIPQVSPQTAFTNKTKEPQHLCGQSLFLFKFKNGIVSVHIFCFNTIWSTQWWTQTNARDGREMF